MAINTYVGARKPIPGSTQQITGLSSVKTLTVPRLAQRAVVSAVTQGVYYTDDGSTPASSLGHRLIAGESVTLLGREAILAFKAIEITTSAVLNVSFYKN